MEKELFYWDEFDMAGDQVFVFMDCELVKDIGKFKKGNCFDIINVDFENGILEFYTDEKLEGKYSLHLTVGDEII